MQFIRSALFISLILLIKAAYGQTDTTTVYYNVRNEVTSPEFASTYRKVFKEKQHDRGWKVMVYDNFFNKHISAFFSSDSRGEIKDGKFIYYNDRHAVTLQSEYQNDTLVNDYKLYNDSGKLVRWYHYTKGVLTGRNMSWHENANTEDSFLLDAAGSGRGYGYYKSGRLRYEGLFTNGAKEGSWEYFYDLPQKQKSMDASFTADSVLSFTCYKPDGKIKVKDCFYEREAAYIKGRDGWLKYLISDMKRHMFSQYLKSGRYTAVIRFMVDTDGSITDAVIENPRNRDLDELALKIVSRSKDWLPAIQYGQPVKAYRRQPITFAEE